MTTSGTGSTSEQDEYADEDFNDDDDDNKRRRSSRMSGISEFFSSQRTGSQILHEFSQNVSALIKQKNSSAGYSQHKRLLESDAVQFGIWVLIWLDIILLLYKLQSSSDDEDGSALVWVLVLQTSILLVFVLELLAQFKFVAHRLTSSKVKWLWWDTILVLVSMVCLCIYGLHANVAVLPRMPRIFRILYSGRYHECYRPVLMLFGSIFHSIGSLFYGLVIFALTIIFFAVVAVEGLRVPIDQAMGPAAVQRFGEHTVEDCKYAFSSLISSISTLFVLSVGDQWHHIAYPIIVEVPSSLAFFMSYFLIVSVVIVGTMFSAINHGQTSWGLGNQWCDKANNERIKRRMIKRLQNVFESIDSDGNGILSWQEFYHNRNCNVELRRILEKYDLDENDLDCIWSILDVDQSGSVDQQEFVDLMWRLQSGEFKFTTMKTGHLTAQVYNRVDNLQRQIGASFQQLTLEMAEQRQSIALCLELFAQGVGADHSLRKSTPPARHSSPDPSGPQYAQEPGSTSEGQKIKFEKEKTPREKVSIVDKTTSIARTLSQCVRNEDLAAQYMRAVPADRVAKYGRPDVIDFWSCTSFVSSDAVEKAFYMSSRCERCDFFISHCWSAPDDWYKYFNPASMYETYEYKKTLELYSVLDHVVSTHSEKNHLSDLKVWIDKSCIPQRDQEAKALCVSLIEEFLKLSDGFIVLLSWHYFTRLWCVYEWACFLRLHHPRDAIVSLGCDAFLKSHPDETLPRYLQSIENLSVKGAQCFNPDDHAILEEKVFLYYDGDTYDEAFGNFEAFAKSTAVILVTKQLLLWRACKSKKDEQAWLGPIRKLAERLGDPDLCNVLAAAEPAKWYKQCNKDRDALKGLLHYWFESTVVHYLLNLQEKSVRSKYLSKTSRKTNVARGSKSQKLRTGQTFDTKNLEASRLEELKLKDLEAPEDSQQSDECIVPAAADIQVEFNSLVQALEVDVSHTERDGTCEQRVNVHSRTNDG